MKAYVDRSKEIELITKFFATHRKVVKKKKIFDLLGTKGTNGYTIITSISYQLPSLFETDKGEIGLLPYCE